MEIIYDTLKYSNVNLSCMACKILSILTFYSHNNNLEVSIGSSNDIHLSFYTIEYCSVQCQTTISIDSLFITELLKIEKNEDKCVALLQILYTSFKALCYSKPDKKILLSIPVNFESEIAVNAFYGLYHRLQMMCCKVYFII